MHYIGCYCEKKKWNEPVCLFFLKMRKEKKSNVAVAVVGRHRLYLFINMTQAI